MRKRRRFTQVTAAFLATLMVFTNVDMAAFAVTEGSGTSTGSTTASYINSVTALQEDIAVQELEVGSSEADIVMPSVLEASVTQYTTINIQTPTQTPTKTPTQGATQPATTSTTQTTTSGQNTTQTTTSGQNTTQTTTSSEQNTTQSTTSDQNTNQSTTQTSTSNQTTISDQNSTQPSTGASGTESTPAQSESQAFNISQHNDREETSSSGSTGTTGATNNTAKTVASTKQMELPVTWKIDTEKSTASEFSSVKAGEVYVYTPVFSEDIFVLDDRYS